MATFAWEGKTRTGETKRGTIEAETEQLAFARLRAEQINVSKVAKQGAGFMSKLPIGGGVNEKEIVVFTRQFATMIDAGLPLVQCLDILASQAENKTFQKCLSDVKLHVESGATFSDALKRHPKIFDELYVNLIAAGEVGGILDTILNRLAIQLEKQEKLRKQLKGAMVYPATVCVIAIACIVLLLVKVIPVFEQMFADFGGTLPGPTQMVINLSNWLQSYIVFLLIGIVGSATAFGRARMKSMAFRFRTDALALQLPIFGEIIKKVAVARFTRTLGTMISSGVPILDGLDIVARTAGNMVIEAELQATRKSISEGKTIAEPLQGSKIFPGMMVQMIAVGEETGSMEAMLNKIADFYDDEVDSAVSALTAMLEPLMMVFMGGSIGTILIAMYLPIFTIADTIG